MSPIRRSCKFIVKDDALLIASNGHPFSRLGVVAICASHLGTKHDYQPTDPNVNLPDHELVNAIRDREIQTYQTNPDRITSDYRGEEETRLDYGGRAIWELLQNADDSLAPPSIKPAELIGAKGIGFKSVLEISDEPEIHSTAFHFHFSSKKTMALLKSLQLCNDPPPMTFRIPFEKKPDEYIKELLDQNFTVVRLPFREGKKDFVVQTLSHFDPRILLFCQYLEELHIIVSENNYTIWKVKREDPGKLTDGDLIIREETGTEILKYRRWVKTWIADNSDKQLSVSFCLPLNNESLPIPTKEPLPLHVFFPTKEDMPFHVLMHASFNLEQNRNHVRKGDFDDALLNGLGYLLKRMVSENIPAETILKAFVPLIDPIEKSLAKKIWVQCKSVLQEESFVPVVGGNLANPLKCQTWDFKIGRLVNKLEKYVIKSKLVSPEIQDDKHCREALTILGAQDLNPLDYPKLLLFCKNNTLKECLEALKSLYQIVDKYLPTKESNKFLEDCRDVPCWWRENANPRPLRNTVPLFKKPPENEYPKWLLIDFLDMEFLREYEKIQGSDNKLRRWNILVREHLHDSTKVNFLNFCLLPELKKNSASEWWDKYSHDVLNLLKDWVQYGAGDESIWENENRIQLGQALLIPTDKGWLPAIQCYAGKSWDGPEFFDNYFENISDRGIIRAPTKWPIDIDLDNINLWKQILRFVGVSWELKLIPWKVDRLKGWKIKGYAGNWTVDSPFENKVNIKHWNRYWKEITPPKYDRNTKFDWEATTHEQWAIEFFPDALPPKTIDRLNAIPNPKKALSSKMFYTHEKKGYWGRTYSKSLPSFACWLLRKFTWIPCKPTLFYPDNLVSCEQAYMPGTGLKGLLPEIDIKIPEGQEGRNLETFLTQDLNIREELPPSSSSEWKKWLEKLSNIDLQDINKEQFKKTVRIFFKALLILPEKPKGISQGVRIPNLTMERDNKSGEESEYLSFLLPQKIYWLDKHYFAEPKTRSELIRRFNIFLMELNEGQKAQEWFELKPLSDFIKIIPKYGPENQTIKQEMLSIYQEKYNALSAISKEIRLPKPTILKLKVVKNLRLSVSDEKGEIARPIVTFWKGKDNILVEASTPYRGLGQVLSPHRNKRQADFFENILRANSWQEVLERLREHGISEAIFHDFEEIDQQLVEEKIKNGSIEIDNQGVEVNERIDDGENPTINLGQKPIETDQINEILPGNTIEKTNDHKQTVPSDDLSQLEGGKVAISKFSGDGQMRRIKGKEAEEWIRSKLEKILDKTWKISTHDRDDQGRESDIVLRKGNVELHVEVKHMKAGAIYWSQKEVSKAFDNIKYYFMVICCPESDQMGQITYREYWLLDPLENLKGFECFGCWLWQNREHITLTTIGWDVPEDKPSHEADNFSFYIKLSKDSLRELSVGNFERILKIIESS